MRSRRCKSRRCKRVFSKYRAKKLARGGTMNHSTLIDETAQNNRSGSDDFQNYIMETSWGSQPHLSDLLYTNSEDSLSFKKTPIRKISKKFQKGLEKVKNRFRSY